MTTITIKLDDDRFAKLKAWAKDAGLKAEELACELLEQHLDDAVHDDGFTPEQRAAIEAGLAAIERGEVVSQEDVFAKLEARYRT